MATLRQVAEGAGSELTVVWIPHGARSVTPPGSRITRGSGVAAGLFLRSVSLVVNPCAVLRNASRPRRMERRKMVRIDDFLGTSAKCLDQIMDPAMAKEKGNVHEQNI